MHQVVGFAKNGRLHYSLAVTRLLEEAATQKNSLRAAWILRGEFACVVM
jgi:hypothetical protein